MKEAKRRRLERGWKEVGKVTSARETGNKLACLPRIPASPDSSRPGFQPRGLGSLAGRREASGCWPSGVRVQTPDCTA